MFGAISKLSADQHCARFDRFFFYDYSDYIEGQGVYAAETEAPCEPEDDPEYLDEK